MWKGRGHEEGQTRLAEGTGGGLEPRNVQLEWRM